MKLLSQRFASEAVLATSNFTFCTVWQNGDTGRVAGDGNLQNKLIVLDVPSAFNFAIAGFQTALGIGQTTAGNWLNSEAVVSWLDWFHTKDSPVEEITHGTISIVIEANHICDALDRSHMSVLVQRIPAFPNGGGSGFDRIQPTGSWYAVSICPLSARANAV